MTLRAESSTDLMALLFALLRNAWEWDPAAVTGITYALIAVVVSVLAMALARQDNAPSRRRWAEGPRPSAGRFALKSGLVLAVPLTGFLLLRFLCR